MNASFRLIFFCAILIVSIVLCFGSNNNKGNMVSAAAIHEKDGEVVVRYAIYDNVTQTFSISTQKPDGTSPNQILAAGISVNFTRNSTGWDIVDVTADANVLNSNNASLAYYGCGLLEGYVTWESILANNYSTQGSLDKLTYDWIEQNIDFMERYAVTGTSTTAHAVKRFLAMLKGMAAGVNQAIDDDGSTASKWTLHDTLSLCAQAELGDIERAARLQQPTTTTTIAPTPSPPPATTTFTETTTVAPSNASSTTSASTTMAVMEIAQSSESPTSETALINVQSSTVAHAAGRDGDGDNEEQAVPIRRGVMPTPDRGFGSHCSASVIRTADDLIFAHDTWSSYSSMIRQLKTYRLETDVVFSSYPGQASLDDWLINGHRLGIQETTNDCNNDELFREYVLPNTVLTFLRTMAASVWASTAPEWSDIFLNKNSGTYSNQWMIVDFKLVTEDALVSKKPLPQGTFVVLEQMPGRENCVSRDQTDVLNAKGFWKSFNLAYYESVRKINGDAQKCKQYGNFFCYDNYSRSMIYERNASQVVDLDTMEALQQYNGASYDPLSLVDTATLPGQPCDGCDPAYSYKLAIAARGDLVPATNVSFGNLTKELRGYTLEHSPFGAIDTKLSSFKNIRADDKTGKVSISYRAKNGPPTSGGQLPVFDWNTYVVPAGADTFYLRHRGQPAAFAFKTQDEQTTVSNHASNRWPTSDTTNPTKGLSGGEIAAIVLCLLVFLSFIVFALHRYNQKKEQNSWGTEGRGSELETGRGYGSYQHIR